MSLKLLLFLSVLLVSACGYDSPPQPTFQINGDYVADQIGSTSIIRPFRININNPNISIQGCNNLRSTFLFDSSTQRIRFQQFSSTRRFCTNDQDGLITSAFDKVRSVSFNGQALVFTDQRGIELFRARLSGFQSQSSVVPQDNNIAGFAPQGSFVPQDQSNLNIAGFRPQAQDQSNLNVAGFAPQGSFVPQGQSNFNIAGFAPQGSFVPQDQSNLNVAGFAPQGSFVPQDQSNFNIAGFRSLDSQPNFQTLPPNNGQSSSIQGQYDLTIPAIPCNIDRNSHVIQGCNSHTINIQTSPDGSVIFTPTASTRRSCQRDFDREYLKAYSLGRYLENSGNGYRILDQNRRSLLQINQSPSKSYLLSLPSVRLNVDDQGFIFEGCNINTLQYTLNQQNIQFGQISSTTRICLSHDYDQLIADAIRAASTYQLSNQGLVLLTNNSPVIIAIIRGINVPTTPVINFPQLPTYPVVVPTPLYPNSYNYGYPVPTVSLPGVTYVSLKGTYTFSPQNSELSSITIKFDDEYLQFEGCNIHRLPYAAYTDEVFCLLQGGSSTQRDCTLDQDNDIINFIRSINRYSRTDDGYTFYSYQSQVASLVTKVRNQIVRYSVINGGYRFEIPGIDVTVSENAIVIQGCNTISIPYSLYRDGRISFGNPSSTLVFCARDTDPYYTQSVTRAVSIKQSADGFILYDQSGAQTARFITYFLNQQSSYLKFNGKFKLQLPSAGIRLKVSDGVFSLSGCNQFDFKFTLADNGNIQFGGVTSSKTTCAVDTDNAFLYTLLKAQSIEVVGNSIVFKNGNGIQIGKANNFDLNDNQSPPLYVDPKSPVVPLRQFTFPEGTYRLNLLRSSVKALSASINRGILTVSGCNVHTFNINAYSNGNVTFTLTGSTRRYCQQDYDSFFLEAFDQVIKYDSMKGMYTFYDSKKSLLQLTAQSSDGFASNTQNPVGPESFISLKGRYRFQIPKVGLQIIDGSFVFRGKCQHRVPCTYKNTNIFFGNPISSSNCSGIKDDRYFLNMIPQILTFQRQNNQFTFFNSRLQSLFNAGSVSALAKNVEVVPGLNSGSYEANFPAVDVEFDDKNIFFNRCKKSGFGYRASNQGVFNFSGDARPCSNDYFDSFKNAFEGANKYIQSDNGFILQDESGNQRGRCIKY